MLKAALPVLKYILIQRVGVIRRGSLVLPPQFLCPPPDYGREGTENHSEGFFVERRSLLYSASFSR